MRFTISNAFKNSRAAGPGRQDVYRVLLSRNDWGLSHWEQEKCGESAEPIMSLTTHYRATELHNLAAHAHSAAAAAHEKQDHLTAHELSRQAHELSASAHRYSEEMSAESAQTKGLPAEGH